ncbi:MAG: hypothetical protein KGL75_04520, partial [Acidobacteriota bacterium]|nr:hypothetical protein [Acidobacteriota bacterium]
ADAVQREWETAPLEPREWQEATAPILDWNDAPSEIMVKVSLTVGIEHRSTSSERLKSEIERARRIAKLTDDWDGEGSAGYSKETVDRATGFVSAYASNLWETYAIDAPIPTFGPGPEGSIDVHWKLPHWELLVNIPSDRHSMATFYGDDYGEQKFRGSFDPSKFNLGIASWLIR